MGGICVSRSVRDYVHGRLDLPFEPIGELRLKNIGRPVEAYVLKLDPDAAARTAAAAQQLKQSGLRHRLHFAVAIAAIALIVIGAGAIGWWRFTRGGPDVAQKAPEPALTAATSQAARPAATAMPMNVGLSNAPQLSAVVLPFNNLGGKVSMKTRSMASPRT